jgi:hypothetical protein
MAIVNYTMTWDPVAGSLGYLVEFKKDGDTEWTVPSSPSNPTLFTTYAVDLESDSQYTLRLSSIGTNCVQLYRLITLDTENICCPSTYLLSPDNSYCYKVLETPATPPSGSPDTLVAQTFGSYSTCGSYIYSPGYSSNGTGTSSQISTTNSFWINWDTVNECLDHNLTDGPLNRTGVWSSTTSSNQDIGFSVCINIEESKTYYVGIACDNYGIIKLDGTALVTQDVAALDIEYPQCGALSSTFKIWHIYPVDLTAGFHILEVIGHNVSAFAAMGAEVYDNTEAEIRAATSYGQLNLIFSSKDYVGQPVQIGTDDAGYTCPDGYALNSCDTPYVCVQILTTSTIPC